MNTLELFSQPQFKKFFFSRLVSAIAQQMLLVLIAQSLYDLTGQPLDLGFMGLWLFLANFIFSLPAGHTADRLPKKIILIISRALSLIFIITLIAAYRNEWWQTKVIFPLLFLWGIALTFEGPANQSWVSEIVSAAALPAAITWNSFAKHIAIVLGPLLGGLFYALAEGPLLGFVMAALLWALALIFLVPMINTHQACPSKKFSLALLLSGLHFVWNTHVLLGIISLDLFAVLLGGAVALLPIYANEILHVGPSGLGVLRAAPSMGSAVTVFILTRHAPMENAGKNLLITVALFGICTLGFGLAQNFWQAMFFLLLLGAFDMVSVIIRNVLVQTLTPLDMRGRVSAVNQVFIGASNELGEFESGLTAALWGTVPAVIVGGLGTLGIVALWHVIFPEISKIKKLEAPG